MAFSLFVKNNMLWLNLYKLMNNTNWWSSSKRKIIKEVENENKTIDNLNQKAKEIKENSKENFNWEIWQICFTDLNSMVISQNGMFQVLKICLGCSKNLHLKAMSPTGIKREIKKIFNTDLLFRRFFYFPIFVIPPQHPPLFHFIKMLRKYQNFFFKICLHFLKISL